MSAEAEVYREAASLIRKHGWVQGRIGSDEDGFCLRGALGQVLKGQKTTDSMEDRLWALADSPPAVWNDDEWRTVEDVLTLLEQAATEAEKEER